MHRRLNRCLIGLIGGPALLAPLVLLLQPRSAAALPKEIVLSMQQQALRQSAPGVCRCHVHIFFLGGLDVLDCEGLSGTRDALNAHGYLQTYYGRMYHAGWFHQQILRIVQEDEAARVVLIGFGRGATQMYDLADRLGLEAIDVQLLVCIEGDSGQLAGRQPPRSVRRVMNVRAAADCSCPSTVPGAENLTVLDPSYCRHFQVTTRPETLDRLLAALADVAASVPVVEEVFEPATRPDSPDLAPEQAPEPLPVPRPLTTAGVKRSLPAGWEFVGHSGELPPPDAPTVPRVASGPSRVAPETPPPIALPAGPAPGDIPPAGRPLSAVPTSRSGR